eukprot:362553-Chlamydomonas_euryale.AAC.6
MSNGLAVPAAPPPPPPLLSPLPPAPSGVAAVGRANGSLPVAEERLLIPNVCMAVDGGAARRERRCGKASVDGALARTTQTQVWSGSTRCGTKVQGVKQRCKVWNQGASFWSA